MSRKNLISIFFIVMLVEMLAEVIMDFHQLPYGIWLFKPLIMPILMYWYYKGADGLKLGYDKIIMAAFFFSWWGDIFLMPAIFPEGIGFLLGLGSFLLAHVMYAVAFTKTDGGSLILKKRPHLALIFILFGASLILYLRRQAHPDFLPMQIPVIVYASVIMIMVIMAVARYNRVNHDSFKWVMIGALMFMFSDTLIALSRFSNLFESAQYLARLAIMPLYVIGQYLIAKGALLQHHSEEIHEGN